MEHIQLDCSQMTDRASAHAYLARVLDLPDWYGSNLDALHDCLTELTGKVRLINWEIAENRLGAYGAKAKKAIAAAALRNTGLDLYL